MRQALHLLETSTAEVATSPRQGALVVSCVATFMMRWLIPRLYAFNALHRKIEVRLSASHAPVDFARDGIDIAIRVGRPPWPRNVVAAPFLADRIGPVCAPALLNGRKTLRLARIAPPPAAACRDAGAILGELGARARRHDRRRREPKF